MDDFDEAEYVERLRAWLDERAGSAPKRSVLAPQDEVAITARRAWQRELADAGYLGVTWPERHGGAGGVPAQRILVERELDARGIAGGLDFVGLDMIGPTILACGTPEQCERYLPPLLRAEEVWCQLLSEPGAGSDLAAVQTRARRADDGSWVIDGQKVWTSFARHAAFGIMLARTDPDVPRHKGLTVFLVPMDSAGITIRPLRQITGDAEFNEVFLDGLVLPDAARLGGPGEGWKVAVTMLSFERLAVGSGHLSTPVEELVAAVAPARQDPRVRVRLGQVASDLLALHGTSARLMEEIASGRVPGPEAGLVKITSVLSSLAACRLAADVGGPGALLQPLWGNQISALPGVRSAGGTEEIIRNQVGERVLGLPPEPRAST
ncbi:MAG TPA: acyl-CoA dehydrogenase family protein [Solirubrobacteraceae bacterium]|jgi:alkylation response protein AidB-like acyl-CoA dehydrogenase|nr:acyl-CoA dehydrogenase family protein [Solirubrobacteraceae bacterium]